MGALSRLSLGLGLTSRGASGPAVVLSASSFLESANVGDTVATASMGNHPSGASGWTFSIDSQTPTGKLSMDVSPTLKIAATSNYDAGETSISVTFRATKVGEDDVVTTRTITVTNVFEAANLAALGFSGTLTQSASSTITITSATATSTLSLGTGSLPAGMTLNSGARIITGTPTTLGSGSAEIIETLADSANSPRSNTWNWEVVAAGSGTAGEPIGLLLSLLKAA